MSVLSHDLSVKNECQIFNETGHLTDTLYTLSPAGVTGSPKFLVLKPDRILYSPSLLLSASPYSCFIIEVLQATCWHPGKGSCSTVHYAVSFLYVRKNQSAVSSDIRFSYLEGVCVCMRGIHVHVYFQQKIYIINMTESFLDTICKCWTI
jgi:hypothetical protein